MRLDGQRALVTGAGGALGSVISALLATEGADVACLDVDEERAARTAESVRQSGRRALVCPVDLSAFEAVQTEAGRVLGTWGGIDILVNCAGGGAVSFFHEMSYETWAAQVDRNLTTVFNITRALLPHMLANGYGRIVNISSVAAISGGRLVRGATAYAAAKAGVVGLTKALAIEVAEQGVTVNCLAPGAQDTPGRARDTPERRKSLLDQVPTRALGRPEDLAQAVVFLAAPEARNITGVVLPVDGGVSI
jgi:3-oxoacyl-[acyl-carrier protein] reductase